MNTIITDYLQSSEYSYYMLSRSYQNKEWPKMT